MRKHTPGPWKARKVEGPGWPAQQGWHIDYNDDQEQVTDFVYEEADAHLIAAAPDLLEALENLMGAYSEPDDRLCCSGTDCGCMGATRYQQAEHYARAAIAKAQGDQ